MRVQVVRVLFFVYKLMLINEVNVWYITYSITFTLLFIAVVLILAVLNEFIWNKTANNRTDYNPILINLAFQILSICTPNFIVKF